MGEQLAADAGNPKTTEASSAADVPVPTTHANVDDVDNSFEELANRESGNDCRRTRIEAEEAVIHGK